MRNFLLLASVAALASCSQEAEYTLYSTDTEQPRRHIATFDSSAGEMVNRSNCHSTGAILEERQSVRYWCEKGSYRS